MKRRIKKFKPMSEINVVPYIDVSLVLLVIFMVTAPLLNQGVQVNLPKTTTQKIVTAKEPIIVSINAKGELFLNTAPQPESAMTLLNIEKQVSELLRADQQNKTTISRAVLVKGDHAVDYGKVVAVMAALKEAGAPSVGLITDIEKT